MPHVPTPTAQKGRRSSPRSAPSRAEDRDRHARRKAAFSRDEGCASPRADRQGHKARESGHAKTWGGGGSMRCGRTCLSAEAATGCGARAPTGVPPRDAAGACMPARVGRGGTAHTRPRPRPGRRAARCRPPDGPARPLAASSYGTPRPGRRPDSLYPRARPCPPPRPPSRKPRGALASRFDGLDLELRATAHGRRKYKLRPPGCGGGRFSMDVRSWPRSRGVAGPIPWTRIRAPARDTAGGPTPTDSRRALGTGPAWRLRPQL